MKIPESEEDLLALAKAEGSYVFFFEASWCPDCSFIKPFMPEIEKENSDFEFIQVDRDKFIDLAKEWDVFGIPSFVAYRNGKEIGRLVNKARKTKTEVNSFLADLK